MEKIRFQDLSPTERAEIYQQIGNTTGMSPIAVEKDWWVTQTLSIIFNMKIAQHLVFKGGTSLSKAWQLIQRFSEDIDLAIERSYFNYHGDLNRKQRTDMRKKASAFVSGDFFNELKERFIERSLLDIELKVVEAESSDQDPRIVEIYYQSVFPQTLAYVQPRLQVEIGCRSLIEPFTLQTFSSLVDEYFPQMPFTEQPVTIPTVNPERTFLEKIFLLHEEFQRPPEKMRTNRLSRHLYDVYHLSKTKYAEIALNNQELYTTIVEHRYKMTRLSGVDYNLHQPQTINPIPTPEVIKDWEDDYNTMLQEMIYEKTPPTFKEIIIELEKLKNRINTLPWVFPLTFDIHIPDA